MSFLEELAKQGLINQNQVDDIKSRAKKDYNGNIDDALSESGIPEDKILEAKGAYLNLPIKKVGVADGEDDKLASVFGGEVGCLKVVARGHVVAQR